MTEGIQYVVVIVVTFCYLHIRLFFCVHVGMNNFKQIVEKKVFFFVNILN